MTSPSSRGFTLIETLVAVAILTTAIVGPFVAIEAAITASYTSRDQLVATMLAQEGIEYVRSVRDGNYMSIIQNPTSGRSWLFGLDGSNGSVNCVDATPSNNIPHRCLVDPFGSTEVETCDTGGSGYCEPLKLSTAGIYTHDNGTVTPFTRTLTMEALSATEMRIAVSVNFTSAHKPYVVRIEEVLYNWL
jgi:prepilin-type N-terminal cleavage/methylation domain-containing protein